jgi:hypothetical protein
VKGRKYGRKERKKEKNNGVRNRVKCQGWKEKNFVCENNLNVTKGSGIREGW